MRLFGRDITWAPPPSLAERGLEQVTDIGVAFADQIDQLTGMAPTSIPAVYRSSQLLADTVGSLPMEHWIGNTVADTRPPLLEAPDPNYTYEDTLSFIAHCLIRRGNAYLLPRGLTRDGFVESVLVAHPEEMTVTWDARRLRPQYQWRGQRLQPRREVIHIRLNRELGGLLGVGPIEAARLMIEGAKAEQNLSRRLAEDNATPSGLLKVAQPQTEAEAEGLKDKWEEAHGNRKRPAVLTGGVEFEPLTFKPVDLEFIEARRFSVQEIARLFGLHGFFLLVDSGSSLTYSTTESLFRLFLTMTLRPTYLERIEQAFSLMMPHGHRAVFNTDEVLRADIEARYRAYQIGISSKFLTPNEARRPEGLADIEGGDELIDLPQTAMNGASNGI